MTKNIKIQNTERSYRQIRLYYFKTLNHSEIGGHKLKLLPNLIYSKIYEIQDKF